MAKESKSEREARLKKAAAARKRKATLAAKEAEKQKAAAARKRKKRSKALTVVGRKPVSRRSPSGKGVFSRTYFEVFLFSIVGFLVARILPQLIPGLKRLNNQGVVKYLVPIAVGFLPMLLKKFKINIPGMTPARVKQFMAGAVTAAGVRVVADLIQKSSFGSKVQLGGTQEEVTAAIKQYVDNQDLQGYELQDTEDPDFEGNYTIDDGVQGLDDTYDEFGFRQNPAAYAAA